jgi:hypothetical protein
VEDGINPISMQGRENNYKNVKTHTMIEESGLYAMQVLEKYGNGNQ